MGATSHRFLVNAMTYVAHAHTSKCGCALRVSRACNYLDRQMQNLKVVSQRNLSNELGWVDVRCDRASVLGNPFDMGKDESLREPVCKAYKEWLWLNIKLREQGSGNESVILDRWCSQGLRVAPAFKYPTANQVVRALLDITEMLQAGKQVRLICWCKRPDREVLCHADTIVRCISWMMSPGLV